MARVAGESCGVVGLVIECAESLDRALLVRVEPDDSVMAVLDLAATGIAGADTVAADDALDRALLQLGMFLGLVSSLVNDGPWTCPVMPLLLDLRLVFVLFDLLFCLRRHLRAETPLLSSTRVLLGMLAFPVHLEVSSDRYFLPGRHFLRMLSW